jgi:hypothetical protein
MPRRRELYWNGDAARLAAAIAGDYDYYGPTTPARRRGLAVLLDTLRQLRGVARRRSSSRAH